MISPTKQCDFHIFFMKLWESVRPEHIQCPLMSSELASAALASEINTESISTGEINILTCPICSNSLSFWCNFFCLFVIYLYHLFIWQCRWFIHFVHFVWKKSEMMRQTPFCVSATRAWSRSLVNIERTSTEKADHCLYSHYLWKQCYIEFSS